MGLIDIAFLEARIGSVDATKAQAVIDDASAIVVDYVNHLDPDVGADDWDETSAPATVQAVVAQMVQRGILNPLGLTGENLGDHGWQANPRVGVGPYLAPKERRMIRRAVQKSGFKAVNLDGYFPVEPHDDPWLEGAL